jgi:hypothetical protein
MPRRAVPEDEPRLLLERKRTDFNFDAIVAPLGLAGHEERCDPVRFQIDGVLLQVRDASFVAGRPRIQMNDRIAPGTGRNAAMFQVVILLNGAVQLPDRRGEHTRCKPREVVLEQLNAGRITSIRRAPALDSAGRR